MRLYIWQQPFVVGAIDNVLNDYLFMMTMMMYVHIVANDDDEVLNEGRCAYIRALMIRMLRFEASALSSEDKIQRIQRHH